MDTQFMVIPEGKIAYDDAGQGPLVVCVPGMGDLRGEYRFLAPQLVEAGYRVVTLDLRGHGESSAGGWQDVSVAGVGADILALIRHLGAGPAVIIGNSMAAGAAVWAAAEAPELVRGLVLVGPAVRGEMNGMMRLMLGALFARPWGPAAWRWYYGTLFPSRKPADWQAFADRIKANMAQPGRLETLRRMMFASKAASAARLSRVQAPALAVMGSRDPDFKKPAEEAEWVAGQVHGTAIIIEGAGHYPFTEMPEVTNPQILAFLKTLYPEVSHAAPTR